MVCGGRSSVREECMKSVLELQTGLSRAEPLISRHSDSCRQTFLQHLRKSYTIDKQDQPRASLLSCPVSAFRLALASAIAISSISSRLQRLALGVVTALKKIIQRLNRPRRFAAQTSSGVRLALVGGSDLSERAVQHPDRERAQGQKIIFHLSRYDLGTLLHASKITLDCLVLDCCDQAESWPLLSSRNTPPLSCSPLATRHPSQSSRSEGPNPPPHLPSTVSKLNKTWP